MKIPKLLQAVLTVVGIYFGFILVFDVIIGQPIPKSLLTMYMFFIIAGILMVFTFTEEGTKELVDPIKALVDDPSKKTVRNVVFIVVPLVAGLFAFNKFSPSFEAPVELRSIHPAPPSSVKVFDKRYNLMKLENPYREHEEDDPEHFAELVAEGASIYIQNCHFCHGDKLDGRGPYAEGFNPAPMNFQDIGTIAQLQESFLFWRIATGGPGLPKEGAPWLSSMPAWEEYLDEDEIWKVILFLYDYTGHVPRSFGEE
jgi:mono/diheme cytochrome c family protein